MPRHARPGGPAPAAVQTGSDPCRQLALLNQWRPSPTTGLQTCQLQLILQVLAELLLDLVGWSSVVIADHSDVTDQARTSIFVKNFYLDCFFAFVNTKL